LKKELKMSINQLETELEAITTTIAYLEKNCDNDEELLDRLKEERRRILKELNVHSDYE
jgi:chaperonin GroEL (HSP60 family)